MKKKIISLLLAVVMIVGMVPLSAISAFAENVPDSTGKYIARSWDSTKKQVVSTEENIPQDAKEITADTRELLDGWYVVKGDVTIEGDIETYRNVNLILTDGSSLTVNGTITSYNDEEEYDYEKGAFSVYSQSDGKGMGALTAENIDGNFVNKIEIHGGSINSVYEIYAQNLSVYGGSVTVSSEMPKGQIIAENKLTVCGGNVSSAAGIGADEAIISGGNVSASDVFVVNYKLTVDGGSLTVGSDIILSNGFGNLIINDGNVKVNGGIDGARIMIVYGGTSTVHGVVNIREGFQIEGGFFETAGGIRCDKDGHGLYRPIYIDGGDMIVKRSGDGPAVVGSILPGNNMAVLDEENRRIENPDWQGTYYHFIDESLVEPYRYYDEESKEFKTGYCTDYEVIDKNNIPTTLEKDKWYLVKGTVGLEDALTVPGNAHIILANNALFTVSNGIAVKNGANLTFYAQTDDFDHMGKVKVTNTYNYNAAIGSVRQGECGDITINGGAFYVEGGLNAAGIGAGADGKCGTITINGGKVFTISGEGGAGIGSGTAMDDGYENTCKAVVINGGVIGAVSQFCYGEHIGAGEGSKSVDVTIADGVYKNDDLSHVLFINIEPFPETDASCVDGHKEYFKNCVSGKYYTTDTLEPESLIKDIDEWLAGEGNNGKGDGNHKDTDKDGYCDTCGTLAKANINFYISYGGNPAFTLPCISDEGLMKQTDEPAQQAVYEKYGATAGLVNYMYSNGNIVGEHDLVPFGTESMDIYAVLAYDETQPTRTKNGHKAYYENTLEGCFYEDDVCTVYIGDADALKEWLSTPVEEGGGMIPATGEPLDTPTADDFDFIPPTSCVYDGQPKQASVTTDKDGMGEITVKYQKQNGNGWDSTTADAPTGVGKYRVVIAVDEGENYAGATDITSDRWVFEIFCQHKYIDYVCEYCGDELFDDAQKDAIKAIDYTADHSDDEAIILIAENAVNAINDFRDEYNTVADVLKIRDLTVSQINAIKAIIAAAGNSTNRTVKAAVIAAKADICSAESVEDVVNIRDECLADIEKLTGTAHEHTYSENWSCDPYYHWHDSTCEHSGLTSGFGMHSFGEGVVNGNVTEYTCTECGYQKIVYNTAGDNEGEIITGISYTGISLTLGSDISINFYMNLTEEARQNGKMTFDIGGRIVTVDGKDAKYNSTEKKYYFSTPLTALEMAEIVTATFTYNGVSYVQKYSVADYVDEIVGNEAKYGKKAVALARKIANYGYYAQIYLESIHSNVEIVDPYTDSDKGYDRMDHFGGEFDINVAKAIETLAGYKVTVSGASDNLSLYGSTVYFDAATALNYYVTVKNGVKPTATAVNKVTGETKQVEIKLYKDNIYIVSVKDIIAIELADDIAVTIDGEITLTGSVFAYCNSVVKAHSFEGASQKDTFAVNAMAAFYEYYAAAMEYISFELHFDIPEKYKVFTADGEEITGDTTLKCYRTFSFRLVPDENYKISRVISGWDIEPDENGLYTVSYVGGKHNIAVYTKLDTYRLTVNVEGEDGGEMPDTKILFVYDSHESIEAQGWGPGIYKMDVPKGKSGTIVITKSGYQEYRQEFTADGTKDEITVNLTPND